MAKKISTKFGDAVLCKDGYFKISNSNKKHGGKLLHRLIYEEYHEVSLDSNIIIHHIDGDKSNNHISNLTQMNVNEHIRLHKLGKNNPNYGGLSIKNKIKLSKSKNTTGYFRVSKIRKNDVDCGFTYMYQGYDESGVRKNLSSVDLKKLERKVRSKNLEWFKLKNYDECMVRE